MEGHGCESKDQAAGLTASMTGGGPVSTAAIRLLRPCRNFMTRPLVLAMPKLPAQGIALLEQQVPARTSKRFEMELRGGRTALCWRANCAERENRRQDDHGEDHSLDGPTHAATPTDGHGQHPHQLDMAFHTRTIAPVLGGSSCPSTRRIPSLTFLG